MSANHSLLLFEGNMMEKLPSLFECFDLETTGTVETAKGLAEIWEFTNWPRRSRPRNVIHKAVLYNGTWTAVLDREMNMVLEQDKCMACAEKFGIKIFGYMIENVSGTCAMYLYAPNVVRGLNIQNFEILEDFGDPLPQETGLTTEDMLGDGVMRISRRMGFSDALFAHPTSRVSIVGMVDPTRTIDTGLHHSTAKHANHGGTATKAAPVTRYEKPWWKLW